MKVALVSREYPPQSAKGGIGTQTYSKAHGLSARGHEVWVLSESAGADTHSYADAAVQVIRMGSVHARMRILSEPVDWLSYSVEVAQHLERLHNQVTLDLVDFPEWGGEGYCFLLNRPEWDRTPAALVHIHGPLAMFAHQIGWPDPRSDFYRIGTEMEGTSLRLADNVISSSRFSAERCAEYYQLSMEIPVIHTGVDTGVFRPLDIEKCPQPTIIFAGKLSPAKGVFTLVEACCRLAKRFPGLRLRMLGSAGAGQSAELQSKASEHPGLLEFAGFVPHSSLPEEFSRAHVFAAPSICEGGPGFAWLEAMSCGLPAIACSETGAAEVVKSGETGILVAPNDVDGLVKALQRLLEDEEFRLAMGQRARRFVETEADSSRCLDRLEEHYLSVAATGDNRHTRPEAWPPA